MNPFKLLASAFKRLTTAVTSPFRMLLVRIQRLFNVNVITARLITPLTKKVRSLITLRPQSKDDYVAIGRHWVYKKLFLTLILALCACVFLYFTVFAPPLRQRVTQPESVRTDVTFAYDDMALGEFTGVCNIKSADGGVVYVGEVAKGVCTGQGTLYSRKGKLLYTGGFLNNLYEGQGTSYFPDGGVQYEGGFSQNRYAGEGKLYRQDGTLLYEGGFKDGLYEGEGRASGADGALLYRGGFLAGERHGSGTLYGPGGLPVYEGDFFGGVPQGTGTFYTPAGKKLYTGPAYGGGINYRALVGATLGEVEEAFAQPPVVAYTSTDSCFIFEDAGVILSADCRVQVQTWKKPRTADEAAKDYYYLPNSPIPPEELSPPEGPDAGAPEDPDGGALDSPEYFEEPLPGIEPPPDGARTAFRGLTGAMTLPAAANGPPPMARGMSWVVAGGSGGSGASSAPPASEPEPAPGAPSEPSPASRGEQPAQSGAGIIIQQPSGQTEKPDFIEEERTLYFEIDRNVWQPESELDKEKVKVREVTVLGAGEPPAECGAGGAGAPVSVEDCVAIDAIRRERPTAFSNITFELDKQNRLFLYLKNVSYADRVERRSCTLDGLTYTYNAPMDAPEQILYYSIAAQS